MNTQADTRHQPVIDGKITEVRIEVIGAYIALTAFIISFALICFGMYMAMSELRQGETSITPPNAIKCSDCGKKITVSDVNKSLEINKNTKHN